jgi:adenosylcobyric acid synthase
MDESNADTLLVAGTASHVGKSTVVAGLCRLLARRGYAVAPFKAQNMSNNARVAPSPDGDPGELGVSQAVQARAARTPAHTDMNPVLLKPRGDGESQVVVDGRAVTHGSAGEYYDDHWDRARRAAERAHARLAAEHEVVVAEGAGSIAEINLHDRDLANVETARFADADVLLVGDIERGGVFAALYGTLELVPEDVRDRVVGCVITKFRGDRSMLDPGIEEIRARTDVPVLGVLPHDDPGLPAEDSLSLPPVGECGVVGTDDGVPAERSVTVAVPRLGRASNVTDLEPLAATPGVRVAYVSPDTTLEGNADAVVLPGSKNTVDDLFELRAAGFEDRLAAFDGPVVGLCGGYQMLGDRVEDAGVESTRVEGTVEGFGLLPVVTRFRPEKRVEQVTRAVDATDGPLVGASCSVTGYEIHAGRSEATAPVERPVGPESALVGDVLGTYLHGLFETAAVREAFVDAVYDAAGRDRPDGATAGTDRSPYEAAADLIEAHVDLTPLGF